MMGRPFRRSLMRRLLAVVLVLALVFVGVGFYRGWFQVQTDRGEGTYQVDLTIDETKMKADATAAQNQAPSFGKKAQDPATPAETSPR